MIKSPQRLLAISIIICVTIGLGMDLINKNLVNYSGFLYPTPSTINEHNLALARYYWNIGDFDKAINEYQLVMPTLPKAEMNSASQELERLLLAQKSVTGKIIGNIAYYSWLLPTKLYELAILFSFTLIFLFIYRYVKKTPKFVFQNFYNYTDLDFGSNLPQIAIDRIHEITWRAQNLENASNLFADNIEIPTLNLMSEGDNQSAVDFLEVALMFSIGSSNLPFSDLINTIKLWLNQPLYLVRGVIDRSGEIINIKISLLERKKNSVEKVWCVEVRRTEGFTALMIVDAIIYPLLYHFNNVNATRWESLQALHAGLEEFQLFREDQSTYNHLRAARQKLEHALALDPGYAIAKYNLSLLLIATGEFEKARDYLKELSTSSDDALLRLRASYNHGVALFLMSQDWAYDQSVKIFKDLLVRNENKQLSLLIQSALAMTYAKMAERRPGEKINLVNQSLAKADEVLQEIESTKKRKKNPDKTHMFRETAANALAAKGYAYTASEDYEQAIEYFNQAVKLHPESITSLLGLGETYLRRGRRDEAIIIFKKAAIQSPLSGYINYRLGNLYRELGEHDEAINIFKRAPQHAHARLTLGKIYVEDEEFEKALDEFRQAVHINSHLSEAWVSIAWTILQMENKDLLKEAVNAARRSLQTEKNEKQKWHRHAILACCLIKTDKASQAASEAMKAVELAPNQPQAHYYLGLAQKELGQHAKARRSAQKAINLDKNGFWTPDAVNLLNELPKDKSSRQELEGIE